MIRVVLAICGALLFFTTTLYTFEQGKVSGFVECIKLLEGLKIVKFEEDEE